MARSLPLNTAAAHHQGQDVGLLGGICGVEVPDDGFGSVNEVDHVWTLPADGGIIVGGMAPALEVWEGLEKFMHGRADRLPAASALRRACGRAGR